MLIFDSQKSWSPRTSLSPHFRPSSPSQSSWSSSDRWSSTLLIIVVKAGLVTLTFGGQGLPVATVLLNSLFITSSATSAFPLDAFSTPSIHNQYGKTLAIFFLLYPMLICFSTRSMVISQHSNIFQLVTKERNSLEWMTRRGCLGVRTKVTPGLCLSLWSHIRHIRSARSLPLSRTVLSTICTFLSYTPRSSLCPELLSVNYHHNRYICNVRTDPAFTVGTSAHPSS